MEPNQTQLTNAQATRVIIDGVNREAKRGNEQARQLIRDAIKLQGFNIRKLASAAEVNGELTIGFDSYLSYMSNANGVAAMFEFDMEKVDAFLKETTLVGLSAIYRAFRELFSDPKPKAEKPSKKDEQGTLTEVGTPLEVILSLIPHLTADERLQVAELLISLDTDEADVEVPQAA